MNAVLKLVSSTRICKTCNEVKPIAEFAKRKDYVSHKCYSCNRIYHNEAHARRMADPNYSNKRKASRQKWSEANPDKRTMRDRPDRVKRIYGITWDEVLNQYEQQRGLCANNGCKKEVILAGPISATRGVIDHCHSTGKFRGILCHACNTSLGQVKDSQERLLGLAEYLNKSLIKE